MIAAGQKPVKDARRQASWRGEAGAVFIDHGDPGIYNIAQSNRHIETEKARVKLGWTPEFRLPA
jgi:hypothetical protein